MSKNKLQLTQHIKEHAILGVNPAGSNVLTVGTKGRYKTIQAAIDFIESQESFTLLDKLTPAGTYIQGLGWINTLATNAWAIDSSVVTITDTNNITEFLGSSGRLWFRVEDDTYYYPYETHTVTSADIIQLRSGMDRLETTISLVNDSKKVFFYTENRWIVKLEDPRYAEQVTIDANVCIRFEGNGSTWTHPAGATQEVMIKGTNFESGVIEFSDMHLANEGEYPWLNGGVGKSWEPIAANENTIAFRFINDCFLDADASDLFSPAIQAGSMYCEGVRLLQQAISPGAHFFYWVLRGDASVFNTVFHVRNNNPPGILKSDGSLLDATEARRITVSNLSVVIDDKYSKLNKFVVVEGANACPLVIVTDISITTETSGSPTLAAGVGFVAQVGFATVPVLVDNTIFITNCHINAPNIDDVDKYIYKGDVAGGNTGTVHIQNCPGSQNIIGSLDTVNALHHDYLQSISYAAAISPNANLGNIIEVGSLTGAITINALNNPLNGQKVRFKFTQDATGSRVITWNAVFKAQTLAAGGTTTKAIYDFEYDGTHWMQTNTAQWL